MGFFSKKPKQPLPEEQGIRDLRLIGAARDGNTDTVRTLLASGADVHSRDDEALMWAARNGHSETVTILLAGGANVRTDDNDALRAAALNGHAETVRILLASGADVHVGDDEALRWAAGNGDTETVQTLLAAGADVHAGDDEALRWAAGNGDTETVNVLQEALAQRLELERQRNPLNAGTGLTFAESRPEDMEALLHEAMAEQERMRLPTRAGVPPRDYVPLSVQPMPL